MHKLLDERDCYIRFGCRPLEEGEEQWVSDLPPAFFTQEQPDLGDHITLPPSPTASYTGDATESMLSETSSPAAQDSSADAGGKEVDRAPYVTVTSALLAKQRLDAAKYGETLCLTNLGIST